MKVLFIARATLHKEPGGDSIQMIKTAKYLRRLGVEVDINLTHEVPDYSSYDLLHFFNIIRPADILVHLRLSKKPYVVSPIFVEYGEYDRQFRKGLAGILFRLLPSHSKEFIKVVARRIFNGEKIMSMAYMWLGQKKSMQLALRKASFILPNSYNEYARLSSQFNINRPYAVIPNGIDPEIFFPQTGEYKKDESMVLCVGRIEGIKNQLTLINALNKSRFNLYLIGKASRNQHSYWLACKKAAGTNIHFVDRMEQQELVQYYKRAKVHVLPSWFETTGLSSLEAAVLGCNIVITDKGDAKEYFNNNACYCDPGSAESIYNAVEKAALQLSNKTLPQEILTNYTWQIAAGKTMKVYTEVLKTNL